ncbi:hypothetical protein IGI04_011770 [Brassica rapa subsp. trilocularis]|uniref:ENTH domain-containing protein n=1 Tax=Brassica rapa subsp. trilocularis TaxID=1813537 RepID=A0ABQ7N670_BRACM|nr:hypothetical protein IGI04_011770 [Brassica rapa subsp. trilocularis]
MSATIEKAVKFIESTQEADGSRYVWKLSSLLHICIMVCSEKLGNIHRIRRKSKPGANRLFKQDRPPREIRSVFTALRN